MASPKVTRRKINWKTLCNAHDKNMKEKIVVYEFRGRKFKENQTRKY